MRPFPQDPHRARAAARRAGRRPPSQHREGAVPVGDLPCKHARPPPAAMRSASARTAASRRAPTEVLRAPPLPHPEPILSRTATTQERRRRVSHRPPPQSRRSRTPHTARNLFPLSNFRPFLTLFSKFFSSFLHSTCSLSVSCLYLALDGIYHPLGSAFPSKSTLRRRVVRTRTSRPHGAVTLSSALFQGTSGGAVADSSLSSPQAGAPGGRAGYRVELFPLHSPLLGESSLVSFPPLINMLKFSGSSCLI